MTAARRLWASILIGGFIASHAGVLRASDDEPAAVAARTASSNPTALSRLQFRFDERLLNASAAPWSDPWQVAHPLVPSAASMFGQRRGFGRGGRRHGAAQAEVILGSVAAITGAALLVYANRPECSTNTAASGCGYGTKVVGGAVLSAGIVSLVIGAATWR
jgi:hypothetical protein